MKKIKRFILGAGCLAVGLWCIGCFKSPNQPKTQDPGTIVPPGDIKVPSDSAQVASLTDSLFTLLVKRVQLAGQAQSYGDWAGIDFISLRNDFNSIIQKQSTSPKANFGFMVSALLTLNTSTTIKELVDSLDVYSNSLDAWLSTASPTQTITAKRSMHNAYASQGIIGLGKALAVRTGDMVRAQTQKPSFPSFVTQEFIQKIAEGEVVPTLDMIITAAERLEQAGDMSINLVVDDNGQQDSFDLDKGEIYSADALCHLARAYLGMFCAYDMNLYAPGTMNYSWYDDVVGSTSNDSLIITFSGDTLYHMYKYNDIGPMITEAKIFKYNLGRTGFMTIRKANHAKVKADLLAVADLVKTGITYIRNETDNQDNDIIKMSSVNDADRSLVDFKSQLIKDGVSPALANKFATPESIADFVTLLLSGPYTFDETIDSTHVNLTVNLAAWFDDPVTDLRTLLPRYAWTDDNAWTVAKQDDAFTYASQGGVPSFYVYSDNGFPSSVRIAPSLIDSVRQSVWGGGDSIYYLKRPIDYTATIDSSVYLDPLRLVDDNNTMLTTDRIDSLIKQKEFFPYFTDYTFHGVFPAMTRQKWIDLIYQ
jgi:hypothetical protein